MADLSPIARPVQAPTAAPARDARLAEARAAFFRQALGQATSAQPALQAAPVAAPQAPMPTPAPQALTPMSPGQPDPVTGRFPRPGSIINIRV